MRYLHKILCLIFIAFPFAQSLDHIDLDPTELRSIVATASRSTQKVFVEEFVGSLDQYSPSVSFAISELLDEFPETLISIEWHSAVYSPSDSDYNISEYDIRAAMYDVGGIPHTQWNGIEETIGGYPDGNWQPMYDSFLPVYYSMVGSETPYGIEINGTIGETEVSFDVVVWMDSDMDNSNQKVEIFLVEDQVEVFWEGPEVYHNARNLARGWIATQDLSISTSGQSETFSGTFELGTEWNSDSVKIIALIQNYGTPKQIHQVAIKSINDLTYNHLGIVITEIMPNPGAVSDSYGEWFEIYNTSDYTIDITGWVIKDAVNDVHIISSDTASVFVAPGDYFVFAKNGDESLNGGLVADYVYSGYTLSNSQDEIILTDSTGAIVDEVHYTDTWPYGNGISMEIYNAELDNNVLENWYASPIQYGDGDYGTPGYSNNCYPAGDLDSNGELNILDVNILVSFLLNNNNQVSECFEQSVDVNSDSLINILDAISLVNTIMD